MNKRALYRLGTVLLAVGCVAVTIPAGAGVSVKFDAATLNELMPALTAQEITVPLAGGRTLTLEVHDLTVIGFDPTGPDGRGSILTRLRLRVPQMGLDLPVEPRVSLHVVETDDGNMLEMRFEQVSLKLPLGAAINVAAFMPPWRFPADNIWVVEGVSGDSEVRSRLAGITMGRQAIHLEFELKVVGSPPR